MSFLKELRTKSFTRGQEFHRGKTPKKNLEELLFRATELGGETGECLEAVKKLARQARGMKGGKSFKTSLKNLREEIGDVVISLDRLAEFFDIDLEDAIKHKFNLTSKKKGLKIKF